MEYRGLWNSYLGVEGVGGSNAVTDISSNFTIYNSLDGDNTHTLFSLGFVRRRKFSRRYDKKNCTVSSLCYFLFLVQSGGPEKFIYFSFNKLAAGVIYQVSYRTYLKDRTFRFWKYWQQIIKQKFSIWVF